MSGKIRSLAAISAVALAASATTGMAGSTTYDPEFIGYQYDYFADAAKTQYLGTVYDQGCGQSGSYVYVNRVYVPSAYVDLTPIFYCGNGQMEPIQY